MTTDQLISIRQFCTHYQIEFSFIETLSDYGLVEIVVLEEDRFIHQDKMRQLEKMVRLHQELQINAEGIDVVHNLLEKISSMQQEMNALRNKLRLYED